MTHENDLQEGFDNKVCLLRGRCEGACTPLSMRGLPGLILTGNFEVTE